MVKTLRFVFLFVLVLAGCQRGFVSLQQVAMEIPVPMPTVIVDVDRVDVRCPPGRDLWMDPIEALRIIIYCTDPTTPYPPATPTPTLTPTATMTPTATATFTPIPLPTDTPTSTPEPTLAPTFTPSPPPTEAPTPTATSTPTGTPSVLPLVRVGGGSTDPGSYRIVFVDVVNLHPDFPLGAIDADIVYDPAVVRAIQCVADPFGQLDLTLCNIDTAGRVQFSASSATGTSISPLRVVRITFQAVGVSGQSSVLDLQVTNFADVNGVALPWREQDGLITISSPTTVTPTATPILPTVTPTPTGEDTPTPLPTPTIAGTATPTTTFMTMSTEGDVEITLHNAPSDWWTLDDVSIRLYHNQDYPGAIFDTLALPQGELGDASLRCDWPQWQYSMQPWQPYEGRMYYSPEKYVEMELHAQTDDMLWPHIFGRYGPETKLEIMNCLYAVSPSSTFTMEVVQLEISVVPTYTPTP